MIVGAALFVPPQAYVEQVTRDGLALSYPVFWTRQLDPRHYLCLSGPQCTGLPLNHLWFVGYIWAYSLGAAALSAIRPVQEIAIGCTTRWLRGPGVAIVPLALLALARLTLFPAHGITNHLFSDRYNHASSFGLFMLGYLVAFDAGFWSDPERYRWVFVALALPSLVYLGWRASLPFEMQHHKAYPSMLAFATNQWSPIAVLLGFGRRYLPSSPTPVQLYLRAAFSRSTSSIRRSSCLRGHGWSNSSGRYGQKASDCRC